LKANHLAKIQGRRTINLVVMIISTSFSSSKTQSEVTHLTKEIITTMMIKKTRMKMMMMRMISR
jgi:hypothetical protein